jgi:uncharacterized protein
MSADPPPGGGPMIQGFAPNGFRVDGKVFHAMLLTPASAADWSPPALNALNFSDLQPLIDFRPEFILLGTGAVLVRPPAALVRALDAIDLGLEPMDSRAAARAWGVLRGEGRPIAAAFYPLG